MYESRLEPRVFLIAQPTVARGGRLPDLRPLAEHGAIHVLVPAGDRPTFRPRQTFELISRRLRDQEYDPKVDMLAWAGGDTLAAVLTGIALADLGVEELLWLRYERGRDPRTGERVEEGSRYTPIQVTLTLPEHQLDLFYNHHTKED